MEKEKDSATNPTNDENKQSESTVARAERIKAVAEEVLRENLEAFLELAK